MKKELKLKEELACDVEALEEELENDESLKGVEVSPDLFGRIVNQLKEEGVWKEDENDERDVYSLLSEEEQEALRVGKKVLERRKKTVYLKNMGIAASVALCIFAASMTSEGNRKYVANVWNSISAGGTGVKVRNTDTYLVCDENEEDARLEIQEKLGVTPLLLSDMPEGMEFSSYKNDADGGYAYIYYEYQEAVITSFVYKKNNEASYHEMLYGEKIGNEYVEALDMEVEILQLNTENEGEFYGVQFTKNDVYYSFTGVMKEETFKELVQSINI